MKIERHVSDLSSLRQRALARWDNEGGAGPDGPQRHDVQHACIGKNQRPANAELVQLHTRIISLLAETSDARRALARQMAARISPKP